MELALSLAIAIVALILAVPALFLGVYNLFAMRDMLRQLDLDRRETTSAVNSRNSARNLTSFGSNEVPAIYDNIAPDYPDSRGAQEDELI